MVSLVRGRVWTACVVLGCHSTSTDRLRRLGVMCGCGSCVDRMRFCGARQVRRRH